jgi:hypothetical protein
LYLIFTSPTCSPYPDPTYVTYNNIRIETHDIDIFSHFSFLFNISNIIIHTRIEAENSPVFIYDGTYSLKKNDDVNFRNPTT